MISVIKISGRLLRVNTAGLVFQSRYTGGAVVGRPILIRMLSHAFSCLRIFGNCGVPTLTVKPKLSRNNTTTVNVCHRLAGQNNWASNVQPLEVLWPARRACHQATFTTMEPQLRRLSQIALHADIPGISLTVGCFGLAVFPRIDRCLHARECC